MTNYKAAPTNRFRCSDYLRMLEDSGFEIRYIEKIKEPELPINSNKIDKRFASLSEDELKISELWYVAQKVRKI